MISPLLSLSNLLRGTPIARWQPSKSYNSCPLWSKKHAKKKQKPLSFIQQKCLMHKLHFKWSSFHDQFSNKNYSSAKNMMFAFLVWEEWMNSAIRYPKSKLTRTGGNEWHCEDAKVNNDKTWNIKRHFSILVPFACLVSCSTEYDSRKEMGTVVL